jgi:hypothetical protein
VNLREKYQIILLKYIPENAVSEIVDLIFKRGVHLKITKARSTKLGDFRPAQTLRGHFITINHDLNKYAFLITLIHEFAHLDTWNFYGSQVKPHGLEWKSTFQKMMLPFLSNSIFPDDILISVASYLNNPSASSCVDQHLMRTLRKYDNEPKLFLEELPINTHFKLKTGKEFIKGPEKRKYFTCIEVNTKRKYLVNRLAEVEPVI